MFGKTRLLRGSNPPFTLLWALVWVSTYTNRVKKVPPGAHCRAFLSPDDVDRPPVADGGQDRVVQPQDTVTLNGMRSKDDKEIVSYQWQMLTAYPHAIIEVMARLRPELPRSSFSQVTRS